MSLLDHLHLPSGWQTNFDETEVYCIELSASSSEYRKVHDRITSSLKRNITSIQRIENPFLLACYLLKRQEYKARGIKVKEQKLFHCTGKANVSDIVRNNLDWRRTVRGRFGQGVSFAPSARYSNNHANRSIGDERAIIMMKVLTGKIASNRYYVKLPPPGCDTTSGNNYNVYVKYYDYEFYPMYIAHYTLTRSDNIDTCQEIIQGTRVMNCLSVTICEEEKQKKEIE